MAITADVPDWLLGLTFEGLVELYPARTTVADLSMMLCDDLRASLDAGNAREKTIAAARGDGLVSAIHCLKGVGLVLYRDEEQAVQATPAAVFAHKLLTSDPDPA
jgi:hypothetical protein